MVRTDKKTKKTIARMKKLYDRILMEAEGKRALNEDYGKEHAALAVLNAKMRKVILGIDSRALNWFTDLDNMDEYRDLYATFYHPSEMDYRRDLSVQTIGDYALDMASIYSGLKVVEETSQPNWIRISEGLLFGLLLTDLKGTTCDDIRMPLNSFIIELPRGAVYINDYHTGLHETRYIIVTEGDKDGRMLLIYAWSRANENSVNALDDHAEYFPLDISHGDESIKNVVDVYEEVIEEEGKKLPGTYARTWGTVFGERYEEGDLREKLIRIVVNTILYLSSYNPTVKSIHEEEIAEIKRKHRRKGKLTSLAKRRIKELEDDPHYEIGTDISITRDDIKEYKKYAQRGKGRGLSHPSITRGHWKMQAHGPGWSEHRLIWIKPYVRGKELGESAVSHRYTMENPNIVPFWWPEADDDEYEWEEDYE